MNTARWEKIPRSREVGQSFFTSTGTTLVSLVHSVLVVWRNKPGLVRMQYFEFSLLIEGLQKDPIRGFGNLEVLRDFFDLADSGEWTRNMYTSLFSSGSLQVRHTTIIDNIA